MRHWEWGFYGREWRWPCVWRDLQACRCVFFDFGPFRLTWLRDQGCG